MRFTYAVAAAGMALTALIGASAAHADTGVNGYVQCVGGDAKPPPPGQQAEFWFPSVHVIDVDLSSGVLPEQVVQRLVDMGVKPEDAATRVRCFMANAPH
ncbi:hypothetical protein [Mycobacterium avium]|uniref:hypothetical protein n=1 Tax=Mycobacterium avium TaxID=1764 RepID=UPI0001B59FAF|nr:hypothetical protein [Mycobacterium avium]ETB12506.1 hypothetical protein P863_06615 [Mycobacterium avium subsp. silvaticum ATCC 49884]ETB19544.1 hypothetical protein O972_05575 [Mycobacterium avium subsp. avium 10-9275]ETB23039.1 hypothetical protein O973_05505 [Mycobacterium avium subsp. avium 11-4751]ANR92701.1 hypothetical protein BBJ32_16315 [Mycobacterium avium]AYJ04992.1 hypothetical protein DBO90_09370 [Mycobacterium avium]